LSPMSFCSLVTFSCGDAIKLMANVLWLQAPCCCLAPSSLEQLLRCRWR
jgi:hypothetical protein